MKNDKEYPATHSMSTAWFGIDIDGNVAIFDFNENGPVPLHADSQTCIESILFDDLPFINNGISELPLSDEQADAIIDALEPMGEDYETQETLVQIDPTQQDFFENLFPSREREFYTECSLVRLSKSMIAISC